MGTELSVKFGLLVEHGAGLSETYACNYFGILTTDEFEWNRHRSVCSAKTYYKISKGATSSLILVIVPFISCSIHFEDGHKHSYIVRKAQGYAGTYTSVYNFFLCLLRIGR